MNEQENLEGLKSQVVKGKTTREAIDVVVRDMPNFFVEALTISGGKVFTDVKEIVVPPASRMLDVKVTPSAAFK